MARATLNNSSYNLLDSLSSSDSDLENVPRCNLQIQIATRETDESEPNNMSRKYNKTTEIITNVVHFGIISFVFYIFYLSFSENVELFTWHPPLMIVGWFFLLAQGILSFLGENIITRSISQKNKTRVHWILQMGASFAIYAGFLVIYINKNLKNKNHFTTWHGLLGLISIICVLFTSLGGIFALYNYNLKNLIKPILNKTIHAFFGSFAFLLGCITVILGIYSHWFELRTGIYARIFCVFIILFTLSWTLLKPLRSIIFRLKHIFK